MIDWEKCSPEDFEIQVQAEEIQDQGEHILFPVRVYHKEKGFAFLKSIPIRREFYFSLKAQMRNESLMKIFRARVRDEILTRTKPKSVSTEEQINLIDLDRQSL